MIFADIGALASAAIAILATLVALRVIYLTIVGFARASIFVEPVRAAASGDKDQDEPGIAELIQSELVNLKEEGGGPGLQLMTTADAAIPVGEIETSGGRLKEFAALLKLLPGRTRVVSGRMQPAGAMGQGITITIRSSSNRVSGTITLWERDFVAAQDLPADIAVDATDAKRASAEARECLGLAAAAWVAYRALQSSSVNERTGLLTQDWQSYAQFRVGARMQFLGLRTAARRLYLDAVSRDPRNRGALFNLAILDIYDQNERSAIERLRAVVDELERNPCGDVEPWLLDRLWYRAVYNIAAAGWNEAIRTNSVGGAQGEVKARLRKLVAAADATIDRLGGEVAMGSGSRFADLVRFLVDVRSAAIVLYSDAVSYRAEAA